MHFTGGFLKALALAALASAAPVIDVVERDGKFVEAYISEKGITPRQGGFSGCGSRKITKWIPADNTDPHQNFVFKQITPSVECTGTPSNSVAVAKGLTVGWSFSLTGAATGNPAAGGLGSWFSAGFSVSESVSTTTTETFGCSSDSGASHQGSVCGFQRVQTTAITVKEQSCEISDATCGGVERDCSDTGNTGVLASPNSDQGGSETATGNCYYNNFQLGLPCVVSGNEIKSNPSSIPGGPQFVGCDDPRSAPGQ